MQILEKRPQPGESNESNGIQLPLLVAYNQSDSQLKHLIFSERIGLKSFMCYFYYLLISAGGGVALEVVLIKDGSQQMKQNTLSQNFLSELLLFAGLAAGIYGFLTMMVGYCKTDIAKIRSAIIAFKILFVLVLAGFGRSLFSNPQIGMSIFVLVIMSVLFSNILLANYMLNVLQKIQDNFPEEKRVWNENSRMMFEDLKRQNLLPPRPQ